MGQNAKITRYGSHVVKKKAKKGDTKSANEGRRKLRSVLKEAKKRLREEAVAKA